jgi:SpoU rRNA methylase family enzyme
MKPKAQNEHDDGLLEYLEDIIGTTKYKQPIEDAAKEVEALNDVCLEKSNRVAIVEKEKDNLEVLSSEIQLMTGSKIDCFSIFKKRERVDKETICVVSTVHCGMCQQYEHHK